MRRQKQVLAGAVALIACGMFLWPVHGEQLPQRDPPAPQVIQGPEVPRPVTATVVEVPRQRYLITIASVPANTLIDDGNFKRFFREHKDEFTQPGTVLFTDKMIGKYVVENLNGAQLVPKSALADKPVYPPELAVAPAPRLVIPPAPVVEKPEKTIVTRSVDSTGTWEYTYEYWPGKRSWRLAASVFRPSTFTPAPESTRTK